MQLILNSTLWDIENSLTNIYEDHASLLHFPVAGGIAEAAGADAGGGVCDQCRAAARAGRRARSTWRTLRSFLQLAKSDQVPLETATLSYIADQRMKRAMVELQLSAGSLEMLDRALTLARTLVEMPFDLNLWQAQNIWYEILRTSDYALTALIDDDRARWNKEFNELGSCLSIDGVAISAQNAVEVAAD